MTSSRILLLVVVMMTMIVSTSSQGTLRLRSFIVSVYVKRLADTHYYAKVANILFANNSVKLRSILIIFDTQIPKRILPLHFLRSLEFENGSQLTLPATLQFAVGERAVRTVYVTALSCCDTRPRSSPHQTRGL